ncbi:MAG: 50S ribosomal protein L11 methyltransferase [Deltaproteobacteria bacterium]|nr:50S ribosomal protein L11 methyltransferase [Deltaproteobacteria bacterium]
MNEPFAHRPPKSWLKVSFSITDELADPAAAYLSDLTGNGVEQSMPPPDGNADSTTVTAYLDRDDGTPANREKIRSFLEQLCGRPPEIRFEEIIEEDWGLNWKKHFKPVRVSSRIIVKPTWEAYQAATGEIVIEIDPGLAFGTGLHASTRLALQLIDAAFADDTPPVTVLDVGTGTGILGIAAALFGAAAVTGIDNDPDAVVCAEKNVAQNRINHVMAVSGTDLQAQTGPFDLVVANITSDVLTLLAPLLAGRIAPAGKLILAGILAGQQGREIEQTFAALGLTLLQSPVDGEWQAFLFSA